MNKRHFLLLIVMLFLTVFGAVPVFAAKQAGYEETISYIYLDSTETSDGKTLDIGIVLQEGISAEQAELVYISESTKVTHIARAVQCVDDIVVFRLNPGSAADTYLAAAFRYTDADGPKTVKIEDTNFVFRVTESPEEGVLMSSISHVGAKEAVSEQAISASVAESLKEVSQSLCNEQLTSNEDVMFSQQMPVLKANESGNIVIALDAGHDSSHAGASANGINEEIVTLKLAQYAKAELETYEGVTVYMTRTGAACPYPSTVGKASSYDIQKRIDAAVDAGAQAVISFHLNSYTSSSPNGCLVLCPVGNSSIASDALKLSDEILEKLCAVGFKNQGTRQEKWTITSYSYSKGIPGIIIEHGFVTNPADSAKLKDEKYVHAMGVADATGIAEFYGLKKKTNDEIFLHVGQGEYYLKSGKNQKLALDIEGKNTDANASAVLGNVDQSTSLSFYIKRQTNGYFQIINENSGLALTVLNGKAANNTPIVQSSWIGSDAQLWEFISIEENSCYIRSKLGTYLTRVSADSVQGTGVVAYEKLDEEKQAWVITPFREQEAPGSAIIKNGSGKRAEVQGYTIMGPSTVTIEQMAAMYNKQHKDDYPADAFAAGGAPTIEDFCRILYEEAEAEGVRAEIVFAQAILETGWLRYGGTIQPEWYNFGGLGAVEWNVGGAARFSDVREGLRAQVQHLKAYGSTEELVNDCVDPRFSLVKRGCAPYVRWLGVQENPEGYGWSSSAGYGNDILTLIKKMKQ